MRAYVFVRACVCACIRVLIQNRKSIVRSLVKIRIAVTRRFVFFFLHTNNNYILRYNFCYITSMISLPTIKSFMFYLNGEYISCHNLTIDLIVNFNSL